MKIQAIIKFQVSNFQFLGVTQGKSLQKSHIKSPPKHFLESYIVKTFPTEIIAFFMPIDA